MNSCVVIGVLSLSLVCGAQISTPPPTSVLPGEALPSSQNSSAAQAQAQGFVAGRLIHKEDPKYPKEARKKKIQGHVVLQATVDENGKVDRAAGIRGDLSLINAAEEAVLKWEFEPFTQDGKAVSVQQNLTFNFDLNRKNAELELPLPEPAPL